MAGERVGVAAPWRWLAQAAALLRAHPRGAFGGASVLAGLALLPSLLVQLDARAMMAQALAFLVLLLLLPVVLGGYYRLLHSLANGQEARPSDLFAIFSDGRAMRRLVIANLIVFCLSLLLVNAIAFTLAGEPVLQYFTQLAQLKPGATQFPALPPGIAPFALALAFVTLFSVCLQSLVAAEVALGSRPPLAAIGASLASLWHNLAALLLFFLPAAFFAFFVAMLLALVIVLFASVVAVASVTLGGLVLIAMAALAAIGLYALLFGFFYFAWRGLFDLPAPPSAPVHRIAA